MTETFQKHGGKLLGAANTGLIIFLYATFATRSDLADHEAREHKQCVESRAEQWRNTMDMFTVKRADATNDVQTVKSE